MMTEPPEKIIYCYGVFQERFREFAKESKIKIEFREGFDTQLHSSLTKDSPKILVVVDDLMLTGKLEQAGDRSGQVWTGRDRLGTCLSV